MADSLKQGDILTQYTNQGMAGKDVELFSLVGAALERKKDQAIQGKESAERRMLRDLEQYHGPSRSRLRETKNKPLDGKGNEDTPPNIHLTRQRTDAVAAKIVNMLMPSNERSWGLRASPNPELTALSEEGELLADPDNPGQPLTDDEGQPLSKKELAKRIQDAADSKARLMQREIDDQLKEAHFGKKGRMAIFKACQVGTGILTGPSMTGKTVTVRQRQMVDDPETGGQVAVWIKEIQESTAPGVEWVDAFNWYPQPGVECVEKMEWAFEHQFMTKTEVRGLAKLPGFNEERLKVLLANKPDHGKLHEVMVKRVGEDYNEARANKDRYSIWKYVGPIENKHLQDMEVLGEDSEFDELDEDPMVEVWMSQGIVLKVKLSPMEGTKRLPYYVFNYKRSDNSPFGYSVPHECQDSARVVDSTWHIALHNAALSSGPQVLRIKGVLKPADGDWNIRGGVKQWEIDDVDAYERHKDSIFKVHHIDAHVEDLLKINELARQILDEEIGFPLIAQGEPSEAVPTASGLAMLLNAQSTVQRGVAQCWDDDVMIPLVEQFYDWNMLYNEDDEIKGDFEPVAYGATRLVQRDLQAQHLQVIAGLTDNPRFAPHVKDRELLEQILKSTETDVDAILKTEDEVSQDMERAQPPPLEQAQLREAEAKAAKAELELEKAGGEGEQGISQEKAAEFQLRDTELQIRIAEIKAGIIEKQLERDAAIARASADEDFQWAKLQADLDMKERDRETQAFLAGLNARVKLEKEANRDENLEKGFDSFG